MTFPNEFCVFLLIAHHAFAYEVVFPKLAPRAKRTTDDIQVNVESAESQKFALHLRKNVNLVTRGAVVEWHHPNGSIHLEDLFKHDEAGQDEDCLLVGGIVGNSESLAALDICDGYRGYIKIGQDGYIIQPILSDFLSKSSIDGAPHSLEKLSHSLQKMSIDHDYIVGNARQKRSHSWNGYYYDEFLSTRSGSHGTSLLRKPNPNGYQSAVQCNGPYCNYYPVKKDDPKWLETAIAIDDSVIEFHGRQTVKRYILTLLNIVSAIYGDPTLGADLKFVILRLIFFEGSSSLNIINQQDSKQSLENVNKWNEQFWNSLPEDGRHDIAIWLTRLNIGGPSGYAPVDGICDPARSCSLNRDEGLSSAFIIAHELGHILGLSHDGDMGSGNDCKEEAAHGSVMAPMVGATFSYFHWSTCSAREYHFNSNGWKCAFNYPYTMKNATFIGEVIEYTYSLDDQCRMEFGEGYKFCRSFQLNDPCTHLWCSHRKTPDVCKTKKGPPMDGTECGQGKWCVNGYCEPMSKRRTSKDGLRHNPRAGGWGQWSSWGECSRSCGTGAQFRSRQCDNPRPAYGGQPCIGEKEEHRICSIDPCEEIADFRAQQCEHLFEVVSTDYLAVDLGLDQFESLKSGKARSQLTWNPYEHEDESLRCKLTCFSRESREFYQTGENVVDGTKCSYDRSNDICIQGKCVQLGCDKILDSPVHEDECGICGGDGSKCKTKERTFNKTLEKIGHTKLMILPAGARNVKIQFDYDHLTNTSLSLKEKQTNQLVFHGSNRSLGVNRSSFVTEGTKFTLKDNYLHAKGPLLGPLVVLASADQVGSSFMANVSFSVSRLNDPLFSAQTYEWVIKGWSKCSKVCGGGHQRLILSCIDKSTGRKIKKTLCGPKNGRPVGKRRKCNDFSCDFEWAVDRWEQCTHSCGSLGLSVRQTYCIPSSINKTQEVQLWKFMVDPRKCPGEKPKTIQECNRLPCPAHWISSGWSDCSTSCGDEGVEKMTHVCYPPAGEIFYDCGLEPVIVRKCQNQPPCSAPKQICEGDDSIFCERKALMRYCEIPDYRKKCCRSCEAF